MKTNVTRKELNRDRIFILKNTGNISARRMMTLYEKYMNGADEYCFGVQVADFIFAIVRKHIPLELCSCQTDHKKNIQYLRFRPHAKGAEKIAKSRGVFTVGMAKDIYKLYKCNTKKGYNSGYAFEIALFHYFGLDNWVQDNKISTEGGDLCVNGIEIQAKFAEGNSAATITSTSKILNEINRRLALCA